MGVDQGKEKYTEAKSSLLTNMEYQEMYATVISIAVLLALL